ncbi:MAG: hypothetical protein IMY82_06940, partial [Chloroflexi bacterium]|nr:hypothetical protein [Chloroflexota bacterium]
MKGKFILGVVGAILSLALAPFFFTDIACAENITIEKIYHHRDIRSPNSVGYAIGDRLTFAVNIIPNGDLDGDGFADSDGTSPPSTVIAFQDSVERNLFFIPLFNSPNHFVRSVSYDPLLIDSWQLEITNGDD